MRNIPKRPCYVEIDKEVIRENIREIKRVSNGKEIIGVVKANAYGHGDIEVSKVLISEGVKLLAVATAKEALNIKKNIDTDINIMILGHISEEEIDICIKNNIILTVSDLFMATTVNLRAKALGMVCRCHIALDTGMGRIGYQTRENIGGVISEIKKILQLSNLEVEGIFTHFASADSDNLSFMKEQYKAFKDVVTVLSNNDITFKYIHCQNSAAIINLKEDLCNAVRPGIIIYGYYPSKETPKSIKIKPALSWKTKWSFVKEVPKGTPIGYGSNYVSEKNNEIIGTIPVGYADGLRRELSNQVIGTYNGQPIRGTGNICMDQTMVLLREKAQVGDIITLLDEDFSADVIAEKLRTIPYEILCSISNRVDRIYI